MEVNLGYKYLLLPTKEQTKLLLHHLFTYNQTWNLLLNHSNTEYEQNLKRKENGLKPIYKSATELDKLVKSSLQHREIKFNTKILQQCRMIFNKEKSKTLKVFKKGTKSPLDMLKFKQSKDLNNTSFETTKEQYSIIDYINPKTNKISKKYKILRIFNQNFKIRWTRDLPNNPSSIKIMLKNDKFFVRFNTSMTIEQDKKFTEIEDNIDKLTNSEKEKLRTFAMDSNINHLDLGDEQNHIKIDLMKFKNDNLLKQLEKKLKILQRKQSRRLVKSKKYKIKLSKNFKKTQKKINKIHSKVTNKRDYQLHKVANVIIDNCLKHNKNHLAVEDLNIKNMTVKTTKKNKIKILGKEKTKTMKKNILHLSFAKLFDILKYKCMLNGLYFSKNDPKNTSKSCSNCGNVLKKLDITTRTYQYEECEFVIGRDYNSVLNIKRISETEVHSISKG